MENSSQQSSIMNGTPMDGTGVQKKSEVDGIHKVAATRPTVLSYVCHH
jgi:hypothetical protein